MTSPDRRGLQPDYSYDEYRQRRASFEEQGLSYKTLNTVHKRFGFRGVIELDQISDAALLKARGIGRKTLAEIRQVAPYRDITSETQQSVNS